MVQVSPSPTSTAEVTDWPPLLSNHLRGYFYWYIIDSVSVGQWPFGRTPSITFRAMNRHLVLEVMQQSPKLTISCGWCKWAPPPTSNAARLMVDHFILHCPTMKVPTTSVTFLFRFNLWEQFALILIYLIKPPVIALFLRRSLSLQHEVN